jgi:hypothetical protein
MTDAGSTVPRRQLGRLLRQAREQAGIGLEAAAADLEWSRAKMYRIEAGQTPVRALDVDQMCRLYGLEVIIEEAALYKTVSGMAGQLDALVAAGSSPNISIRVMPLATALHRAAVAGSFAIMDFPTVGARAAEPSTVYSESLTGALYLDKAAEVRTFADAWRVLAANALTEAESRKLIETIRERCHHA